MADTGRIAIQQAMAAARGVAIVIVVLYHADLFLASTCPGYASFRTTIAVLQFFAMPVFFTEFGMAVSRATRRRGAAGFLADRVVNYLYLYLLWSAVSLAVSSFVVQMNIWPPRSLAGLLKTLLVPSSPLWFLHSLVVLLVATAVVLPLPRRVQAVLALLAAQLSLPWVRLPWYAQIVAYQAFFFVAGLNYRDEIVRCVLRGGAAVPAAGLGVFVAVLEASRAGGLEGWPFVAELLGAAAVVSLLALCLLVPPAPLRVLGRVGRAALPIMTLHDVWLHVAGLALVPGRLDPGRGAMNFIVPAGLAALAIVASMATRRVLGGVRGVFAAPPALVAAARPAVKRGLEAAMAPARAVAHGAARRSPPGSPDRQPAAE